MEQITRVVLLVAVVLFGLGACSKSSTSSSAAPGGSSQLSWDQGNWDQTNWH